MKNFKIIALLSITFVALSVADLLAQRRPENTRSARAAYGYPEGGFHAKKKKSKKSKRPKKQKKQKARNKKSDTSQPAYRKKNPWAN